MASISFIIAKWLYQNILNGSPKKNRLFNKIGFKKYDSFKKDQATVNEFVPESRDKSKLFKNY